MVDLLIIALCVLTNIMILLDSRRRARVDRLLDLLNRLVGEDRKTRWDSDPCYCEDRCIFCYGDIYLDRTNHEPDCPWVEARAFLGRKPLVNDRESAGRS